MREMNTHTDVDTKTLYLAFLTRVGHLSDIQSFHNGGECLSEAQGPRIVLFPHLENGGAELPCQFEVLLRGWIPGPRANGISPQPQV